MKIPSQQPDAAFQRGPAQLEVFNVHILATLSYFHFMYITSAFQPHDFLTPKSLEDGHLYTKAVRCFSFGVKVLSKLQCRVSYPHEIAHAYPEVIAPKSITMQKLDVNLSAGKNTCCQQACN